MKSPMSDPKTYRTVVHSILTIIEMIIAIIVIIITCYGKYIKEYFNEIKKNIINNNVVYENKVPEEENNNI